MRSKPVPLYNTSYYCSLEVHEPLYFASLEIGRQVKVLPYLHNYALSYGLFINDSDFGKALSLEHTDKQIAIPRYESDLSVLTQLSRYVTPAWPESYSIENCIWGAQSEKIQWKIPRATLNIPPTMIVYEYIKPNSAFRFFILSQGNLKLPQIIRLGKGRAQCKISAKEAKIEHFEGDQKELYSPLVTPWDIPPTVKFALAGKIINIPPCRLLEKSKWSSRRYYRITAEDREFYFPPMSYFARQAPA